MKRRQALSKHSKKGTQIQVCVALPPQYVDQVKFLAREGPESSMVYYFREALRLLFEKYADTLNKAK